MTVWLVGRVRDTHVHSLFHNGTCCSVVVQHFYKWRAAVEDCVIAGGNLQVGDGVAYHSAHVPPRIVQTMLDVMVHWRCAHCREGHGSLQCQCHLVGDAGCGGHWLGGNASHALDAMQREAEHAAGELMPLMCELTCRCHCCYGAPAYFRQLGAVSLHYGLPQRHLQACKMQPALTWALTYCILAKGISPSAGHNCHNCT
jgi:hypothetical protein